MAKNKKRVTPSPVAADKKRSAQAGNSFTNVYALWFCVACTFAVYIYSALHNQFTNWDDGLYVINNQLIQTWNAGLLTASVDGNWAPVHQLLLAVEYHLFALNPAGYHLTSLLLHLGNVALVFMVVFRLSNKWLVAGIAALFFGIHPMHVESVAWISEQKDLLYTLFYLAAMLMYIEYRESRATGGNPANKFLLLTGVCFILSCLSKGMGVTLPVVLVLIDSLQENNQSLKFLLNSALNKTVFFAIALAFGAGAFVTQKHAGNLNDTLYHPFGAQIMFACYGFVMYLVRFVLPFWLSPLYPYPLKGATGGYPLVYYLSPIAVAVLAGIIVWFVIRRKKQGQSNNTLFFGGLFFLANIILVLQIKAVGHVILAERYTYLSYVGLLFIAAVALNNLWEQYFYQHKTFMIAGACLLTVVFGFCAYSATSIWYNSITLWTQAIDKYQATPMEAMEMAYNNRGIAYGEQGKTDTASADYSAAIAINPKFPDAYNNRGFCYAVLGKTDLAIADYNKAIALRPEYSSAYFNRGLAYEVKGQPDLAIADYTTALTLSPQFANAYNSRGLAYARRGQFDKAIADYTTAVALEPHYATAYNNRGMAHAALNKFDIAIADYDTAVSLNPQYAEAFYNQGLAYARLGKFDLTVTKNTAAININPQYTQAYSNRGLAYANLGKYDQAMADYNAAIGLNPQFAAAYYNRALAEQAMGNVAQAQSDFGKANALGQNAK